MDISGGEVGQRWELAKRSGLRARGRVGEGFDEVFFECGGQWVSVE